MRNTALLIVCVFLCVSTTAVAATVTCSCVQNPNGTWTYTYGVTTGTGFAELEVGICDGNAASYSNWVQPAGWGAGIGPGPVCDGADHYSPATAHGLVSPGPAGVCPFKIAWMGPSPGAGGPFTFGFTHPLGPHDVAWWVMSGDAVTSESWSAPVGMGAGPIHSPVPEPASLLALGCGLTGLAGALLRRRR